MAGAKLKHKQKTMQYALRLIVFLCSAVLPLFSSQIVHADTNDIQEVISQNKIATDDNNSTSTIMPLAATTAADPTDIASGTWGNCDWNIDVSGKLSIYTHDGALSGITQPFETLPSGKPIGLPWDNFVDDITSVYVGKGIVANNSSAGLLSNMPNVEEIDVGNLDVKYVLGLDNFFAHDDNLKVISGLGNWNISNAITINNIFAYDEQLSSISGIEKWDTSNITNMGSMFLNDEMLNFSDFENWNTSNVTSMASMFNSSGISDFTQLANWDVSSVVDMMAMFSRDTAMTNIDVSHWNTDSLANTSNMFSGCKSLNDIKGLGSMNMSKVTDISIMFSQDSLLSSLSGVENWDVSNVANMTSLFNGCSNLQSLDLTRWDTSNVTNMSSMFGGDLNLDEKTLLGISNIDTSKVTNMSGMFSNTGFVILDLNHFNTDSLTKMNNMFSNTKKLQQLKGNFNISGLTELTSVFMNSSVSDFSNFNIEKWDTKNIESFNGTFQGTNFETYDFLKNWNVSSGQIFQYMFSNCKNIIIAPTAKWSIKSTVGKLNLFEMFGNDPELISADMSNWTPAVPVSSMYYMFRNDNKLTSLDLSGFDISDATMTSAFANTTDLWKIKLGPNSVIPLGTGLTTHDKGSIINDPMDPDGSYKAVGSYWQAVGTGTDHEPNGDLYSQDQLLESYANPGGKTETYVWQQQAKIDMKMTVPDIDFGTTTTSSGIVHRKSDFAISIDNESYPTDAVPSDLSVSMDAPLTDETDKTKTLNDVLVFRDKSNNESILSSADTKIYSGEIANGSNTISWDNDHGILLNMNHDRYASNGHYSTTLKWTLTNSL